MEKQNKMVIHSNRLFALIPVLLLVSCVPGAEASSPVREVKTIELSYRLDTPTGKINERLDLPRQLAALIFHGGTSRIEQIGVNAGVLSVSILYFDRMEQEDISLVVQSLPFTNITTVVLHNCMVDDYVALEASFPGREVIVVDHFGSWFDFNSIRSVSAKVLRIISDNYLSNQVWGGNQPEPVLNLERFRANTIGVDIIDLTHIYDAEQMLKLAELFADAKRILINDSVPFQLPNERFVRQTPDPIILQMVLDLSDGKYEESYSIVF